MPVFKRSIKNRVGVWVKTWIPFMLTDCWYWFGGGTKRLPDFVVIGAQKAGSTSIFHWLGQHPDVKMTRRKETQFFSNNYHWGMRLYRSYFTKKSDPRMTGEVCPYYLFHPQVPKRVAKHLPEAKIIALLRDPVARAQSNYEMLKKLDPAKNFEEAISLEEKRVLPLHEKMKNSPRFTHMGHFAYSYKMRGLYGEQLEEWFKYIPRERMLILKSEEFFEQPKESMDTIHSFLGLKEFTAKDLKPQNTRAYDTMNPETKKALRAYYAEDQRKLLTLLPENFQWENPAG